jgi:hypothetical protein
VVGTGFAISPVILPVRLCRNMTSLFFGTWQNIELFTTTIYFIFVLLLLLLLLLFFFFGAIIVLVLVLVLVFLEVVSSDILSAILKMLFLIYVFMVPNRHGS